MTDLYKVLGVSRSDDDDAIRRAYKKLAMKWHPDRNSAPEAKAKFQEISQAYDVLSDEKKRKIYDQFGDEGLRAHAAGHDPTEGGFGPSAPSGSHPFGGGSGGGSNNFSAADAEEIFRRFFGGAGGGMGGIGGMGGMGGRGGGGPRVFFSSQQQPQQPKRGRTSFGGPHPFGSGMDVDDSDDSDDSGFHPFGGSQFQSQSFPQHPSAQAREQPHTTVTHKLPCTLEELAAGFQRTFKISRKVQDPATGQIRADTNVLTVNGLPGWKAGTKITFADAGDQLLGMPKQDIRFEVEEKEHPRFKRAGDNLETEVVVPLVNALCGKVSPQVKSLTGEMLTVPPVRVTPETTYAFPGQGMPRRDGSRGSLVVHFKVAFPELSEAQQAAVRKVLPAA